jgi:hypothetical protein
MKWLNLYGAPMNGGGDAAEMMNEYPETASAWKGRILVQMTCVDTKNPEMKV